MRNISSGPYLRGEQNHQGGVHTLALTGYNHLWEYTVKPQGLIRCLAGIREDSSTRI